MNDYREQSDGHGPPWGWQPSLEHMAREAGVDFNRFLELVKQQVAEDQMAAVLRVSPQTIRSLKDHFMSFGVDSVQGQD